VHHVGILYGFLWKFETFSHCTVWKHKVHPQFEQHTPSIPEDVCRSLHSSSTNHTPRFMSV